MRSPLQLLDAATLPGTHMAARPHGVVHVYTGPLTPSNRFVPRHGSTACRTRTRRLAVLDFASLLVEFASGRRRACGNCSARLTSRLGRAEQITRTDAVTRYSHLTPYAVALLAHLAVTELEVEWVQWLALLLFGFVAARDTAVISGWSGKPTGTLFTHIDSARRRLGVDRDPYAKTRAEYEARREETEFHEQVVRDEAWTQWRADVDQYGYLNAPARPAY